MYLINLNTSMTPILSLILIFKLLGNFPCEKAKKVFLHFGKCDYAISWYTKIWWIFRKKKKKKVEFEPERSIKDILACYCTTSTKRTSSLCFIPVITEISEGDTCKFDQNNFFILFFSHLLGKCMK